MTDIAERDLQATIQAWDQAAWSLAALALAARDDGPPELTAAARELLAATGLTGAPGGPLTGLGTSAPGQIASQAAAGLHLASALASGRGCHWGAQSDQAKLAQGNASAQAARAFAQFLVPAMSGLADDAGFDVAWLPAPFIPQAAIDSGLPRVTAALRPGGWLILGHGKLGGTPVEDAVTRLKAIAYGGTALGEAAACHLLRSAGLTSVRSMPTPAGAPAITIGQKPA
jgi:hypothetical protein